MPIELPAEFHNLMEGPTELAVMQSLQDFIAWVDSEMCFFPDFTEHSSGHLTRILDIAVCLITADAWKLFSPQDAGCLILAVLIHDAAMHLAGESFLAIIRKDALPQRIEPFDERAWPDMWQDFLAEAKRWSAKKHGMVFGDVERAAGRHTIDDLPEDPSAFDKTDWLLGGEFIRRHHTRLAHEFACFGIPRPDAHPLHLSSPSDFPDMVNLAGFVARSHGMSLRESFVFFDHADHDKYRREYKGLHVEFLMALLRIADYLDLYAERAPLAQRLQKRIHSRYSQGEWDAHAAIDDIRFEVDAPGIVSVDATPNKAKDFIRVRSWLDGIQAELDHSWAVLGEVYGWHPDLTTLGLRIRRIRSNLDDPGRFAQRADIRYVPTPAKFDVAGAEMLKLLIHPLYGNRPEVGVRELIQNSVDAVLEMREWCRANALESCKLDLSSLDLDADILVALCKRGPRSSHHHHDVPDDWQCWIEVADRGIGMTADTVINYFLKAGASFRNAPAWYKHFADLEGRSKVARSGRFGIGVFATFLLGNRLRVATRHITAKPQEGLLFEASVEDENVELRVTNLPIGTRVLIELDEETYDYLAENDEKWAWYSWQDPVVRRIRQPGCHLYPQHYSVPASESDATQDWHSVEVEGYRHVFWRIRPGGETRGWKIGPHSRLTCNGIAVLDPTMGFPDRVKDVKWQEPLPFALPSVSVVDPDGRLPLSVTRFSLAKDVHPFDSQLAEEVARNFCAWFLLHAPTSLRTSEKADEGGHFLRLFTELKIAPWVYAGERILPTIPWNIQESGLDRLVVIETDDPTGSIPSLETLLEFWSAFTVVPYYYPSVEHELLPSSGFVLTGFRALAEQWRFESHRELALPTRGLINGVDKPKTEWEAGEGNERRKIIRVGECPGFSPLADFACSDRSSTKTSLVMEWYLHTNAGADTTFSRIWKQELKLSAAIPLQRELRLEECHHAFQQLRPYLAFYRERRDLEAAKA